MNDDFQTAGQRFRQLDPFRRVKYSVGLVMGVDEFDQEQAYFRERDHLHQRALHGYGTVSGLQVAIDGSQVIVTPGLAIDPLGRLVRIKSEQAGDIAEWLAGTDEPPRPAGPDGNRSLYVLLTYAESESAPVAIPGPPGRSEAETHAFSRVDEGFDLRFSPVPPPRQDEEAARRFSRLLGRLRPVAAGEGITPEEMAEQVRSLQRDAAGPGAAIPVRVERADEVLQAAIRVWVTAVRPALTDGDADCAAAVLLARVDFTVDANGAVTRVKVVEEGRPFLLPTHLLQQYLLLRAGGSHDGAPHLPPPVHRPDDAAGGDLAGFFPAPTVTGLQGRPVAPKAPANGAVLTWDAGRAQWEPRPAPGVRAQGATPVLPFVTISRAGGAGTPAVALWFHLPADVTALADPFELVVFAEPITAMGGADRPTMRMPVAVLDVQPQGPNRMLVILDHAAAHHPHLRFEFHLHGGTRKGGRVLQRLMAESGVNWLGYDGDAMVVAFHHYQPASEVVAAGVVEKGQLVRGHNLQVTERAPGLYLLTFPEFHPESFYMVKGLPIVKAGDYQRTFEVVRETDLPGIVVRVPGFDTGFMVEISRIV